MSTNQKKDTDVTKKPFHANAVPKYLYEAYQSLWTHPLCNEVRKSRESDKKGESVNHITDESLNGFADIINKSIPSKDDQYFLTYSTIRSLFNRTSSSSNTFMDFVRQRDHGIAGFILWSNDGVSIINHYGLLGYVYIKWDNTNHKYVLTRFDNKKRNNASKNKDGSEEQQSLIQAITDSMRDGNKHDLAAILRKAQTFMQTHSSESDQAEQSNVADKTTVDVVEMSPDDRWSKQTPVTTVESE